MRSSPLYVLGRTFAVFGYGAGELEIVGVFDLQLKHYLGIIMGFYYKLILYYWKPSVSFGKGEGAAIVIDTDKI